MDMYRKKGLIDFGKKCIVSGKSKPLKG